jgi:hypothetical protein
MMKLTAFKAALQQAPAHQLCFVLPDGDLIAAHAHITEVGRIDKTFVDCGGTVRKVSTCSLQAWVANDTDHRLAPGQLASILDQAAPILADEDLEMEIEYEDCQISQYPVENVSVQGDDLKFYLGTKHTDCLAKDVCLSDGDGSGACACC